MYNYSYLGMLTTMVIAKTINDDDDDGDVR